MHKSFLRSVGVLALAGSLGACDDYLSGPGLTTDPNRPVEANMAQLLHGVTVNQTVWYTANLARTTTLWTQQMAGIGRQWVPRGTYDVTEGTFSGDFSSIYIGGGLIDMRRIQAFAAEANDRTYAGIAKVWEGMLMGMAASMWGDLPYSEAVTEESATPKLDDQAAVYAQVQALLDGAIADLSSGQGAGPGAKDLIFKGNRQQWIQTAYTLKARFYMHWVEAQLANSALANTACGGNCLTKAKDAAAKGISASSNDMRTWQSGGSNEQNMWYQFMNIARAGDIGAGEAMINLLKGRSDPRLAGYFSPVNGEFVGAPPGTENPASQLSAARGAANFRQPLVTYQENQLILAEVAFHQGAPGVAVTHLNNARAEDGLDPVSGLTDEPLRRAIAEELYVHLFQNLEAWNVVKRLCWPALTPAKGTALPGRLFYGQAERNANPNIPAVGQITDRNDNDPAGC